MLRRLALGTTLLGACVSAFSAPCSAAQLSDNTRVRLSTLIWISLAALLAAFFSQLFGWEAIRSGILIVWAAFLLLLAMTRGMRWLDAGRYREAVESFARPVVKLQPGFAVGGNMYGTH